MTCLHAELPIVLRQSSKLGTCILVLSEQGAQALGHYCPQGLAMNMLLAASIALVMLCFHLSCM